MASNLELETRWVDAWDAVYTLIASEPVALCLLSDGRIVDVETCQGWLQTSAYEGYLLDVALGWIDHRRGIIATRTRDEGGDSG